MTLEAQLTLLLAVWGAATGTVALLIQWIQHRSDRAKIHLSGGLSIVGIRPGEEDCYQIRLDVVNRGRRVARIAEVYLQSQDQKPTAKLVLFDSAGATTADLEEGASRRFEQLVTNHLLDVFFESLGEEEKMFVRLTTGEVHSVAFRTLKKSRLEKLREEKKAANQALQTTPVTRSEI